MDIERARSLQLDLVAVVIAFFVCYAPMYFQRLFLAIMNLNSNFDWSFLANFMAYLYVLSGVTFYFGSVINPILYNVVSNRYRRAFCDLCCCRWKGKEKTLNDHRQQRLYPAKHLPVNYRISSKKIDEQLTLKMKRYSCKSNRWSFNSSDKHRRVISH